jgi:hypothetical protein
MPRSMHAEAKVRNDICIVLTGECAGHGAARSHPSQMP